MTKYLVSLVLGGVMALAVAPAHAQLQFTLIPTTQTYAQGHSVSWAASFFNTGATSLTFAGIGFSGLPTDLTADDLEYFNNFDGTSLGAGASVTATLFTTKAAPTLPAAVYNASVTVTYVDGFAFQQDATAAFVNNIISSTVPEPGSLSLLGLGIVGALVVRRRRA